MITNLIWDVDGTLFDTYPAFIYAFSRALRDDHLAVPMDRIGRLARVSLTTCVNVLAQEYGLDPQDLGQRFHHYYHAIPECNQRPFPGVEEVCALIQTKGGANVIATHRGEGSTARLLSAFGMTELFCDAITGDDDFPRKPDPAAFLALIERNGLECQATLAVGDREIDVQAGRAAGVRTCLFRPLFNTPAGTPADFTIFSFEELRQLIINENRFDPVRIVHTPEE